jgi:uncharacterized protein (DUF302 family)
MTLELILIAAAGFLIGAASVAIMVVTLAPKMMIVEDASAFDFEKTIATLVNTATSQGWSVPTVHHIHNSVSKAGLKVPATSVVELCKPDLAAQILNDEPSRVVSSMMPCRIAVYQGADGRVTVSRMNTGLVSRLFGGLIAKVMARATSESEVIIASVLHPERA